MPDYDTLAQFIRDLHAEAAANWLRFTDVISDETSVELTRLATDLDEPADTAREFKEARP